MNYEIEVREMEQITVAAVRFIGKYMEAPKYFPTVFKAIKGRACGAPICCFYKLDEATQTAQVEVCVPTEEQPNTAGVTVKELPQVKAVCTTHVGGYDSLPYAYEALNKFIMENGLIGGYPMREIYIKGPGMLLKGNPKHYITEVIIPLVENNERGE